MSKAGEFVHRSLRAVQSLAKAVRTARPSGGTVRPRGRTAWDRPNPWPKCPACHHRVPGLCVQGCGVCPGCCPGHREKTEGGDQSGLHAWGDR